MGITYGIWIAIVVGNPSGVTIMLIRFSQAEGKEFLVGVWTESDEALIEVATFADILAARKYAEVTRTMHYNAVVTRIFNMWGTLEQ